MDEYQQGSQNSGSDSSSGFGILNIILVLLGLVFIFYLYKFLYSTAISSSTTVTQGQQSAATLQTVKTFPIPFEGGEYSVNTWVYVSSFNKNRNTRKHVLEVKGEYFSTLLIALGAFKNTLAVRTHSVDLVSGVQSGRGSGSGSGATITTTNPPNAGAVGSLATTDVDTIFTPMAMDDDTLPPPVCDLPEIDLQRWTMITVVLSGRTIDVYIDGKLSRSCMSSSYYKVDPTGVTLSIADRGGFDGYIGQTTVGTYSMNPDEIYRAYLSGPQGSSLDILSWIASIFTGAKTG
jgi:hypothetical protein